MGKFKTTAFFLFGLLIKLAVEGVLAIGRILSGLGLAAVVLFVANRLQNGTFHWVAVIITLGVFYLIGRNFIVAGTGNRLLYKMEKWLVLRYEHSSPEPKKVQARRVYRKSPLHKDMK